MCCECEDEMSDEEWAAHLKGCEEACLERGGFDAFVVTSLKVFERERFDFLAELGSGSVA